MGLKVPGTSGYVEHAAMLIERYEATQFLADHEHVLSFLPAPPASVLDIGSGTGRDAAWFAARGDRVVAVEPTYPFWQAAQRLHPSPDIEWINDSLPDLAMLRNRQAQFDLIMMTAVWMHLDERERVRGFPIVAALLKPGGRLIMSLRHGTVPQGRCMYEVTAGEVLMQAGVAGLSPLSTLHTQSIQDLNRRAGVTWTKLVLQKQ